MLEQEVIKSATTEWAVRTVFAPIKNGISRLCDDYGIETPKFHEQIPISLMEECFHSLRESMVFATLDANSG